MNTNVFFTSLKLGRKQMINRFAYQPTETNNCEADGTPTATTVELYKERARARPGIIFVESTDISADCQARSNRMVLTGDNKESYRQLVAEIKAISPETLVIFQLSHAGRLSDPAFKAPQFVYARDESETIMTTAEIKKAAADFIRSALIIDEIGGDGVDMKQAHGFLAGDFLHPANKRDDEYGGSFENRIRFFSEIFAGVKKGCSEDFIIGTRISPYEGIPGGCGSAGPDDVIEDLGEMEEYARRLEKMGIDFINVSAGYAAANLEILLPTATYPEGVYRHFTWTRRIKSQVSIPVVGSGYSHPADGENALTADSPEKKSSLYFAARNLEQGNVDIVGIGRQTFADPLFVQKVRDGKVSEIKWCSTCSGCGMLLGNNKPIGCTRYDKTYAEIFKGL
jgi:2,4-dienoyl-CoA reductase-like NADH-dependent reductase (Old Yellow Enzyme family)